MNFLARSVVSGARSCLTSSIAASKLQLTRLPNPGIQGNVLTTNNSYIGSLIQGYAISWIVAFCTKMDGPYLVTMFLNKLIHASAKKIRLGSSLRRLHLFGPYKKYKKKKNPLEGKPYAKGVVVQTITRKPKKPNSANRKCVIVRLSTGKEMVSFIPREGHNLQEHNIVLCQPGKLKDTPGVKIRCIRGKYDLLHVIKKTT